jgi:hypothetical protein
MADKPKVLGRHDGGDGKWEVVSLEGGGSAFQTHPCPTCPWRRDAETGVFPPEAFRYDFRKERGEDVCRQALREALHGVELGSYDVDILNWLAVWEPATVAVVCSWLYRVREVGR